MKVISEVVLTKEQIKSYRGKGYEVYYGYENPVIRQGESVGFILDTMYKSTMDKLEALLFNNDATGLNIMTTDKNGEDKFISNRKNKKISKVTVLYKGKSYNLSSYKEWCEKYNDANTWHTIKHPLLVEYENKRSEYFEERLKQNLENEYSKVVDYLGNSPKDLDSVLDKFAPLYEIDVDYTSEIDKLNAYASIKYYLENDIEYSKEPNGIDENTEPMFEVISFGDETYLEDITYKESLN